MYGHIGERLESVEKKQEYNDMVVESSAERSIGQSMEEDEGETWNGDDHDGEQDAELDRSRRLEGSQGNRSGIRGW